jgi:hypothetical protein
MFSFKVHVILARFDIHRFWKNPQISNFMKNHPMEAEFFHADTQK